MTSSVSRRRALAGAATLGVAAPVLAACGDDASSSATDPVTNAPTTDVTSDLTPAAPSATPTTATAAASGLVAAADVAVGGGVVLADHEIVVTQPAAGVFKAFSALCTHRKCLVGSVADGAIVCACHGSSFSATDGSVEAGPANRPLAAVAVRVVDGQVRRA